MNNQKKGKISKYIINYNHLGRMMGYDSGVLRCKVPAKHKKKIHELRMLVSRWAKRHGLDIDGIY